MTDFNDLLGQAKKMQEKMKETQDVLKKIEVEGVSGGDAVKIIMNGEGDLKKITFNDSNGPGYNIYGIFHIANCSRWSF